MLQSTGSQRGGHDLETEQQEDSGSAARLLNPGLNRSDCQHMHTALQDPSACSFTWLQASTCTILQLLFPLEAFSFFPF